MSAFITRGLCSLLLCAAQGAANASATDQGSGPGHAGALTQLKLQYLACDRAASERFLAGGEAALCSIVSERLLQEGFGGNFAALLSWWREARPAHAARVQRLTRD